MEQRPAAERPVAAAVAAVAAVAAAAVVAAVAAAAAAKTTTTTMMITDLGRSYPRIAPAGQERDVRGHPFKVASGRRRHVSNLELFCCCEATRIYE